MGSQVESGRELKQDTDKKENTSQIRKSSHIPCGWPACCCCGGWG